jgi:CheY-like chemotaxis protein
MLFVTGSNAKTGYMKELKKEIVVNKNGPVIIIEDDADDQEFLTEIFTKLNYQNKILFFFDGQEALDYINTTDEPPFLILSDINMPKLNGFALREKLRTDSKLSNKCIPYLFFSTAVNQKAVIEAYSQSVQGFFVKQTSMIELEKTISAIMEYWRRCAAPNDFA